MQELIIRNLVTAFREPDLYFGQDLENQLIEMICSSYEVQDTLQNIINMFAIKMKVGKL